MERLDKILSSYYRVSRSDIKKLMKKSCIRVNGVTVSRLDIKVDAYRDEITADGEKIVFKKHVYIMMNKPAGVVSASNDARAKTVVDLVPPELYRSGLFPAGRLDADTTGFVLITDDGDFAHRILSPKNHIDKTYIARLAHPVTQEDVSRFLSGITLADGTECLEARVKILGENTAEIIIHEGKYHQVKRMFAATGNRVLELKRIKMGALMLDEKLLPGQCREMTEEEVALVERG